MSSLSMSPIQVAKQDLDSYFTGATGSFEKKNYSRHSAILFNLLLKVCSQDGLKTDEDKKSLVSLSNSIDGLFGNVFKRKNNCLKRVVASFSTTKTDQRTEDHKREFTITCMVFQIAKDHFQNKDHQKAIRSDTSLMEPAEMTYALLSLYGLLCREYSKSDVQNAVFALCDELKACAVKARKGDKIPSVQFLRLMDAFRQPGSREFQAIRAKSSELLDLLLRNVDKPDEVKKLDLSGWGLSKVPEGLKNFQHLDELNLKDNFITECPAWLKIAPQRD